MRKARKGREYTALRDLGVRVVDEVFKMASPLLREATDLRGNMQVRKHKTDSLACYVNWQLHIIMYEPVFIICV